MKFSSAIFAILFVSGASAFDPNAPRPRRPVPRPMPRNSVEFRDSRSAGDFSRTSAAPSFSSAPLSGVRPTDRGGPIATPQDVNAVDMAWDERATETVQGSSLRTWSFMSPSIERIQVLLRTEGRPLNADVELWQGPDNCPQKMAVYLEDGSRRPFSAVIESPRGSNTVAVRNTAQMEFPLEAAVEPDIKGKGGPPLAVFQGKIIDKPGRTIQGGAIVTYPFDPMVQKVSVLMKTDGRPLNARIELLQGPNNNKQVVEVYCEDGYDRPFMMILDTPGVGNVVRIVNTATVEFPLTASVDPFLIEDLIDDYMGPSSTGGPGGPSRRGPRGGRGDEYFFGRP